MEIDFAEAVERWLNQPPLTTADLISEGVRLEAYMSESAAAFFKSVRQWYLRTGRITTKQYRALFRVLNYTCNKYDLEWRGGF
jgi:hypothetical protein